jgi:hypothetical protein
MSKRIYKYRNREAKEAPEHELIKELRICYQEVNHKAPSLDEDQGLIETAKWIKLGGDSDLLVTWKIAERGLRDGTWDPARGPRDLYSES